MRRWHREPLLIAAGAAVGVAVIVTLVVVYRVFAADPLAAPRVASAGRETVTSIGVAELPKGLLKEVVDHDPFHPERRRPAVPFRLPAEQAAIAAQPAPVVTPAATLRLLGTVVTPGQDAFVVCQLGNDAPKVVRVGGKIGDLTLRKIEPGRAVFHSPNGEAVDVRVAKAGS